MNLADSLMDCLQRFLNVLVVRIAFLENGKTHEKAY